MANNEPAVGASPPSARTSRKHVSIRCVFFSFLTAYIAIWFLNASISQNDPRSHVVGPGSLSAQLDRTLDLHALEMTKRERRGSSKTDVSDFRKDRAVVREEWVDPKGRSDDSHAAEQKDSPQLSTSEWERTNPSMLGGGTNGGTKASKLLGSKAVTRGPALMASTTMNKAATKRVFMTTIEKLGQKEESIPTKKMLLMEKLTVAKKNGQTLATTTMAKDNKSQKRDASKSGTPNTKARDIPKTKNKVLPTSKAAPSMDKSSRTNDKAISKDKGRPMSTTKVKPNNKNKSAGSVKSPPRGKETHAVVVADKRNSMIKGTTGDFTKTMWKILPAKMDAKMTAKKKNNDKAAKKTTGGTMSESVANSMQPRILSNFSMGNGEISGNSSSTLAPPKMARKPPKFNISSLSKQDQRTLRRVSTIYEILANSTVYRGEPWPNWMNKRHKCVHRTALDRDPNSTASIEYVGCCGLGHRLSRMANAAYMAITLKAPLYFHWNCCNEQEVYQAMFGDSPMILSEPFDRPAGFFHHLQFRFEVPGFALVKKYLPCPAQGRKITTDYIFYSALRDRYVRKNRVDDFVEEHFKGHFAVGVHIRAGNGEKGDFRAKGRVILDKEQFILDLASEIRKLIRKYGKGRPGVVFVAVDTTSYLEELRLTLNSTVKVVDVPQKRPQEGKGIMFGEMHSVVRKGDDCMEGWHSALTDMMILSYTDVIVASRTSSFTETLPMSILMGQPNRTVDRPFCEIENSRLRCYSGIQQWSCKTINDKPAQSNIVDAWKHIIYPK